MKPVLISLIAVFFLLTSCVRKGPSNESQLIVSMQVVDRNGFAETMSNKDRLKAFQKVDFTTPQPYAKVLRVYGRNLEGQSTSKITSYHENGHIFQYLEVTDGRAHGCYRQWHPNGKLHIEAFIIEGIPDIHDLAQSSWVFDGTSLVFDKEGNCTAKILYEKGLLYGTSEYYFPDGSLKKILPYEQGQLEGITKCFNPKGILIEEILYKKDEKQGRAVTYWNEDQLRYEEEYDLGKLINGLYYDKNGHCIAKVVNKKGEKAEFKEDHLYSLTQYENAVPEGLVQIFHPNQVLYRSYFIKNGKKQGEELEYYPAEPGEALRLKLSLHWEDDQLQGQVKTWYPNGQIESQRELSHNKKQGLCFAWYKNGDLMLVEEYELDQLLKGSYYKKGDKKLVSKIEGGKGVATLYSPDGFFLRKISYEKGRPELTDELLK